MLLRAAQRKDKRQGGSGGEGGRRRKAAFLKGEEEAERERERGREGERERGREGERKGRGLGVEEMRPRRHRSGMGASVETAAGGVGGGNASGSRAGGATGFVVTNGDGSNGSIKRGESEQQVWVGSHVAKRANAVGGNASGNFSFPFTSFSSGQTNGISERLHAVQRDIQQALGTSGEVEHVRRRSGNGVHRNNGTDGSPRGSRHFEGKNNVALNSEVYGAKVMNAFRAARRTADKIQTSATAAVQMRAMELQERTTGKLPAAISFGQLASTSSSSTISNRRERRMTKRKSSLRSSRVLSGEDNATSTSNSNAVQYEGREGRSGDNLTGVSLPWNGTDSWRDRWATERLRNIYSSTELKRVLQSLNRIEDGIAAINKKKIGIDYDIRGNKKKSSKKTKKRPRPRFPPALKAAKFNGNTSYSSSMHDNAEHSDASSECADKSKEKHQSISISTGANSAQASKYKKGTNSWESERITEILEKVPFMSSQRYATNKSENDDPMMRKSKSDNELQNLMRKEDAATYVGRTDNIRHIFESKNNLTNEGTWEGIVRALSRFGGVEKGNSIESREYSEGTEVSIKKSISSPNILSDINKVLKHIERPGWLSYGKTGEHDVDTRIREAGAPAMYSKEIAWRLRSIPVSLRKASERMLSLTPEADKIFDMLHKPGSLVTTFDETRDESVAHAERSSRNGADRRQFWRSIRDEGRMITIVTTASLPWMTGTAVNPLLRAAYLAMADKKVTLVVPWVPKEDQEKLFPGGRTFQSPEEQDKFVRDWLHDRVGFAPKMKIRFYPGRYAAEKCSIMPVGDISSVIPDKEADVCVLEEPEHLSWYHHGRRWTDKFAHVVGIVHTNYLDYARREEGGAVKSALLKRINQWVCRVYCDKIVKLSDAVQPLPRESTLWVHGVSPKFLDVGMKMKKALDNRQMKGQHAFERQDDVTFSKGCYFIGKAIWGKGYTELLELLKSNMGSNGKALDVDIFGSGDDLQAIQAGAKDKGLDHVIFHGARDHADSSIHQYKVFVNPSRSDVVATTTAEALAMGKFVVVADHPSNEFFKQFENCLIFRTPKEFDEKIAYALRSQPKALSMREMHTLSWEAATERFLEIAEVETGKKDPANNFVDNFLFVAHKAMTGNEVARVAFGGGANTKNQPKDVTDLEGRGKFGQSIFDRGNGPWSGNKGNKPNNKNDMSVRANL